MSRPLSLVVQEYSLRSGGELVVKMLFDQRDAGAIQEALEIVRSSRTLTPLLHLWLSRLPAQERIKLITEAVTERLTQEPDGP